MQAVSYPASERPCKVRRTWWAFCAAILQPLQALAQRNPQCLAKLARAVFFKSAEGLVSVVVDDLEHAVERVTSSSQARPAVAGGSERLSPH
jgi:hypothetical protein